MIYELIFFIQLGILVMMGCVFLTYPVPKDENLSNYRKSLKYIAISYLALAFYCSFKWRIPVQLLSPYFLVAASIQASLIGCVHINLVNPKRVTKRYFHLTLAPAIVCGVVYLVSLLWEKPIMVLHYADLGKAETWQPEFVIRVVWMVVYVGLIAFFIYDFFYHLNQYKKHAINFFADRTPQQINIVVMSFILAMCVGVTTIGITTVLQDEVLWVLNLFLIVLYMAMGICFIKYPALYRTIAPVLHEVTSNSAEMLSPLISNDVDSASHDITAQTWMMLRKKVIDSRMCLKQSITLEDMAKELGISLEMLSTLINKHEGMNFNHFVNHQRISSAIDVIIADSDLLDNEVAQQVGFPDEASFVNYFKTFTGLTPKEYRYAIYGK